MKKNVEVEKIVGERFVVEEYVGKSKWVEMGCCVSLPLLTDVFLFEMQFANAAQVSLDFGLELPASDVCVALYVFDLCACVRAVVMACCLKKSLCFG